MKTTKKLLSLLLVVMLLCSLIPASAMAEETNAEDEYPFIFVHGLMGWGDRSMLDPIMPYWGMTTGNLMDYLTSKGYESYAAQVGPLSSAWDRACELYAQLTGTTVDYGAAHSAEKGHDRYGITYDEPLFEGWSAEKKINLIGHSFGGATARMFLELLTNGSAEEVAAAKAAGTDVSPLFEGGMGDWVYSLTAVAAPHNGTTFIETCDISTQVVTDFIYNLGASLGFTNLKGVYDLQLEHFGVSQKSDETDIEYLVRVLNSSEFMSHNDNAIYDLTIDNALEINDGIQLQDNVYYFSVCGDATHQSAVSENQIPDSSMFVLLKPFGTMMGRYYDESTAGGVYIDKTWLPNDGMVNVVSGLYPVNSQLKCLKADGSQGYVICDGYNNQDYEKGIWNVMPTQLYDHLSIIGGILSNTVSNTHHLYLEIIGRITSTYGKSGTADDDPIDADTLPFTDVSKGSWSYDYILKMYQLGVVNGRSETVFDPTGNVTRAEFVKMLACLDGVDTSNYSTCKFEDVSDSSVFAPYIEWAAENGIVYGTSSVTFNPNDNITREQMAAIICRYADYAGIKLSEDTPAVTFTDSAQISDYAVDSVAALQRAGIICGVQNADGSYSYYPKSFATREQTCKVLSLI
jgi:triacylglycerol lipase